MVITVVYALVTSSFRHTLGIVPNILAEIILTSMFSVLAIVLSMIVLLYLNKEKGDVVREGVIDEF